MPKSRHTVKQQQQHVADWQASSLSRTQYSLQHHLNVKTFCNWVSRWNKTLPVAEAPAFIPAALSPEAVSVTQETRPGPVTLPVNVTLNLKRCSITCLPGQLQTIMAELNLC